jgi:hypothetical protein
MHSHILLPLCWKLPVVRWWGHYHSAGHYRLAYNSAARGTSQQQQQQQQHAPTSLGAGSFRPSRCIASQVSAAASSCPCLQRCNPANEARGDIRCRTAACPNR